MCSLSKHFFVFKDSYTYKHTYKYNEDHVHHKYNCSLCMQSLLHHPPMPFSMYPNYNNCVPYINVRDFSRFTSVVEVNIL